MTAAFGLLHYYKNMPLCKMKRATEIANSYAASQDPPWTMLQDGTQKAGYRLTQCKRHIKNWYGKKRGVPIWRNDFDTLSFDAKAKLILRWRNERGLLRRGGQRSRSADSDAEEIAEESD